MNHAAINALVAEQVMGLTTNEDAVWVDGHKHQPMSVWRKGNGLYFVFDPSRNIAHAMEVFDKWTHASIEKSGGAYEVTINSWATEYRTDICISICLAALRAMGVPDKEIEEVANG